jgi:hypothetical protein
VVRSIDGVISSSSCESLASAASLSTMATGCVSGALNVRPPGFPTVQVAAGPPPLPPLTTVHVAGIPAMNVSFSTTSFPELAVPVGTLKLPDQLP